MPHLEPLWRPNAHRRLVEPFSGGLAVSLGLRPERALLNDANPHLINFYRWLQRGLVTTLPMRNDEKQYYKHRARFNALLADGGAESAEAAAIFYYLNRTGYNGLCRFNKRGEFNVPFGRYTRLVYTRDFTEYRKAFAGWTLTTGDFEDVPLERGDFVYADPPYDVPFTNYSKGGFSWEDQKRTAEWLAKHRGPVVLVNQATERVETLHRKLGYSVAFLDDAPRRISCTGDRAPAREIISTRNL